MCSPATRSNAGPLGRPAPRLSESGHPGKPERAGAIERGGSEGKVELCPLATVRGGAKDWQGDVSLAEPSEAVAGGAEMAAVGAWPGPSPGRHGLFLTGETPGDCCDSKDSRTPMICSTVPAADGPSPRRSVKGRALEGQRVSAATEPPCDTAVERSADSAGIADPAATDGPVAVPCGQPNAAGRSRSPDAVGGEYVEAARLATCERISSIPQLGSP